MGLKSGGVRASGLRNLTEISNIPDNGLFPSWKNTQNPDSLTNPVLTYQDVSDVTDAGFVADPFLFPENGTWHMFFEVLKDLNDNSSGSIAHATSSDGFSWTYDQLVIDETRHMSHPNTFKYDGNYYITPSTKEQKLDLYVAGTFPTSWSLSSTLIDAANQSFNNINDPSVFRYNNTWWAFFTSDGDSTRNTLEIWYADTIEGNWTRHPDAAISTTDAASPCNQPIVRDNHIEIYYQDTSGTYRTVNAYKITDLSKTSFSQTQQVADIISPGDENDWSGGDFGLMHHFDPAWFDAEQEGRWKIGVDGKRNSNNRWEIGIYQAPTLTDLTLNDVL